MKLKKVNYLLLTLLLIFVISLSAGLSSCKSSTVINSIPTDLMARILESFPDAPDAKLYFNGAEMLESGYFDPEFACYTYTGDYIADFDLFDKLDSYAVRIPNGKSAFEIHIFKVRNLSDVKYVEDLCKQRIEILKTGDIAEYDPTLFYTIIEKAEVYTKGNYVFLLSTPDNDTVKKVIS